MIERGRDERDGANPPPHETGPGTQRPRQAASPLTTYLASFRGFERDARVFLLASLVAGAAISLYWINFNLYLAALGLSPSTIGLIAAATSISATLVAVPASIVSDRIGRRVVLLASVAAMAAGVGGLLASSSLPLLVLSAVVYAAGQETFMVVQAPFLSEHSRPEHRSELFSLQFAITNATNVGAAIAGAWIARLAADAWGIDREGPDAYRVLLALMAISLAAGFLILLKVTNDRHARRVDHAPRRVDRSTPAEASAAGTGTEAAGAAPARRFGRFEVPRLGNPGLVAKVLVPGFLIALGAGQVIPFLNLFVQRKFGLDLTSINSLFAFTSLGTMVAILGQPALAKRLGRIGSVVVVQGASIPFLVALGFVPVFWVVALAMAIRSSLMNAGNPIYQAFAMDQVPARERALLSAGMSLLWSLGWAIGGPWYGVLQSVFGFDLGYAIAFGTMVAFYTLSTLLTWIWFGRAERAQAAEAAAAVRTAEAILAGEPVDSGPSEAAFADASSDSMPEAAEAASGPTA